MEGAVQAGERAAREVREHRSTASSLLHATQKSFIKTPYEAARSVRKQILIYNSDVNHLNDAASTLGIHCGILSAVATPEPAPDDVDVTVNK